MNEENRKRPKSSQTSGSPGAILRQLYSRMVSEMGINNVALHDLANAWIKDPKNGIPAITKVRSSEKGNLMKELKLSFMNGHKTKEEMSWKVFFKALTVIRAWKVDFSITVYRPLGRVTKHSITCQLSADPSARDTLKDEDEFREENN